MPDNFLRSCFVFDIFGNNHVYVQNSIETAPNSTTRKKKLQFSLVNQAKRWQKVVYFMICGVYCVLCDVHSLVIVIVVFVWWWMCAMRCVI